MIENYFKHIMHNISYMYAMIYFL